MEYQALAHVLSLEVHLKIEQQWRQMTSFCNTFSGVSSFDVSRYTGTWYEYSNVFEVFQVGGVCVRATYTDNGDGSVKVFNEQIKKL